jgi:hypothetical protein
MPSLSVPSHSGMYVVIGSSTEGISPRSMAMPTSALVKLLAMDQLAPRLLASRRGSYHSATMVPRRTTTTPCVLRPSANAYVRAPSSTAESMPTSSGVPSANSKRLSLAHEPRPVAARVAVTNTSARKGGGKRAVIRRLATWGQPRQPAGRGSMVGTLHPVDTGATDPDARGTSSRHGSALASLSCCSHFSPRARDHCAPDGVRPREPARSHDGTGRRA